VSSSEHIRALEELAAMDAVVAALEEQLGEKRAALAALTEALDAARARLETDEALIASADKQRNDLHVEIRTMNGQIEHSRDKLNRSRTERETNAAQRELEELRKLMRDREDEITRIETETAPTRTQIGETQAEVERLATELAAQEGDITEKVKQLEADKTDAGGGREAISKKLPVVLYRRYEMIRGRRGTAVAQTSDGTCKACNMALPPQLFHKLRREPLIDQCPSCQRIIYFVSPEPQKVD
jgi:uncharacterized protein